MPTAAGAATGAVGTNGISDGGARVTKPDILNADHRRFLAKNRHFRDCLFEKVRQRVESCPLQIAAARERERHCPCWSTTPSHFVCIVGALNGAPRDMETELEHEQKGF